MSDIDSISMLRLARTLQLAVQHHEESWDDLGKKYRTLEVSAVHKACQERGFKHPSLVFLLLSSAWNDAQDWARETIEQHNGV